MVTAVFLQKGGNISMTVSGHSNYGTKGNDIVCSACSILAYTLAAIIESEKENNTFKSDPIIEVGEGELLIACEPEEKHYNEILHAFYVAETGYTLLESNYPSHVKLLSFGKA